MNALDGLFRTALFIASANETPEIQDMLIAAHGMIRDPVYVSRGAPAAIPGSMCAAAAAALCLATPPLMLLLLIAAARCFISSPAARSVLLLAA